MSLTFLKKLNGANNGHFKVLLDKFEQNNRINISWYTSSGSDFRNPIFLNERYMSKYVSKNNSWESPDLFLYTDYYPEFFHLLFPDRMTSSFLKPMSKFESLLIEHADLSGWYLYQDQRTSVRVKRFEYLPSIKAIVNKELVDFPEVGDEPKKVAYMLLEFCSKQYGSFEVNLVYANVENEFMADMLIKGKAEISHITHVRYGSAFGFARASGAYLKNILHKLRVKFFISDPSLVPISGDRAAVKIYPTLKPGNGYSILYPIHVIPGKSWSQNGDVTVYKVKYDDFNLN